jgi:hypothetical protein
VAARLERHVHRRPARVRVAAGQQRLALGVRLSVGGMEALAEHDAVLDHHGADHRVRRRQPLPAGGELDRASQMGLVGLEEDGHGPVQDM